jgi:hypothetical protein
LSSLLLVSFYFAHLFFVSSGEGLGVGTFGIKALQG